MITVNDLVWQDTVAYEKADTDVLEASLDEFRLVLSGLDAVRKRRARVFAELRERGWDMTKIGKRAGMTRQAVANLLARLGDDEDYLG